MQDHTCRGVERSSPWCREAVRAVRIPLLSADTLAVSSTDSLPKFWELAKAAMEANHTPKVTRRNFIVGILFPDRPPARQQLASFGPCLILLHTKTIE